ncbi:MAG TPA: dihydrolipoamide acetyltransferase family protein [Solirubrobacteraceae bacterium]|jgi:pyruvate dehydrogenase E2 component (dihydrolipoamide acetyltransferase)|nr:dihydrolipoamide acetyltransferase family protein [Solirubrobacteraceae bacterium]
MSEIVMPRLSDTMEEGTILRWLKHDGEHVARGEELVEIETDKAAMTYESDSEGILQIVAREGDTLAVGAPIARIGETGDGTSPNGAPAIPDTPAIPVTTDTSMATDAPSGAGDAAAEPSAAEKPQRTPTPGELPTPPRNGERVKASPLARRIAHERGVNLGTLVGSGPGGRIVKADVEVAGSTPAPATSSIGERPPTSVADTGFDPASATTGMDAPAQTAPPVEEVTSTKGETTTVAAGMNAPAQAPPSVEEVASAKGETTTIELSRTQRTIARRMAESKATIPDFTLTTDVDMERCVDLRAELKRLSRAGDGRDKATATAGGERDKTAAPTYNDMIVKACALALRDHPRANGSYRDGRFELHARVNVGVAVAASAEDPTGGALVVPTVFDADTKALGEIARETRTLAERVRDGSITPPELSGGTFTVSNLGMYGIRSFTAIVNPPQAAILAVGAVSPRAVVRKKKLVARQTMSVTLACDHRILYGADAALFLARIRELLEEPAALTL